MLRSYQYTEKSYFEYTFQSNLFRDKQIGIARRFVDMHPIRRNMKETCPICGQAAGNYFFSKWKVDYVCCPVCKSIFAVYDKHTVEEYHDNPELLELRISDVYQEEIMRNRQDTWNEFLEWIEVRAFRFMRRNRNLSIVDYGNRFEGYVDSIRKSQICGNYDLKSSILSVDVDDIQYGKADMVLYLDQMQQEIQPVARIQELKKYLKEDGILILNTRAGSGFDIVTLKEKNARIYPYEHILLPSVKGLVLFLEKNGFEILEITTPGVMDVKYVLDFKDKLDDQENFVKYLLEESSQSILQEFQRFLQKGCLSSFVSVIAKKRKI
ncbi:hypothetical protein D3Z53_11715 [Lachnospiraceae bacterium]|jgi:hypothetical protein|nr:hypothetical protein [uncultured Schaedlerella sp.]NBI58708.1 hypothetical protein [Lachnospiraceae bacterium]